MQLHLSQGRSLLIENSDTVSDFFSPVFGWMGLCSIIFLGLGIFLARLLFGQDAKRLTEARNEGILLVGKTNEIVDGQNQLISTMKKSAAVAKADLEFRDGKIRKLENDFSGLQNDYHSKVQSESQLTSDLRNRERELERLKKELKTLHLDLSKKEEGFNSIIAERDSELLLLRNDITAKEGEYFQQKEDLEKSLRNREVKIMELEDSLGERESMIVALQSDLSESKSLGERTNELENLVAERELEIEELNKKQVTIETLQAEIEGHRNDKNLLEKEVSELGENVRHRDSDIQNIKNQYHESRQQREVKIQELSRQLEEQSAELISLRTFQSTSDKLKSRISELELQQIEKSEAIQGLEKKLEEKQLESDLLSSDNKDLKHRLHSQEGDMEFLRNEKKHSEDLYSRIQELERGMGEKDNDLEKFTQERNSLVDQLQAKDAEISRLRGETKNLNRNTELKLRRVEKVSQEGLHARIRELESLLGERNGDSPVGKMKFVRAERIPNDDIYSRIRDLEKLVSTRSNDSLRSHDDSEYQFTLEDGTTSYLKGDQKIEYEGKIHRAEDLYYILRDR